MNSERHCLNCKKEITGRANKKFCDNKCRSNYNNHLYLDNHYIQDITSILHRNRRILEKMVFAGLIKSTREELLMKGFDFNYFTSVHSTPNGLNNNFCYEYGYSLTANNEVLLIKRP
jgi:hypothetical protein